MARMMLIFLTFFTPLANAQFYDFDVVDGNQWKMHLSNQGSWGFDVERGDAGGEFPGGSDNYVIYAGGLYIGAVKDPSAQDPDYRYSVSDSEFSGDFTPGPVRNSNAPFDELAAEKTPVLVHKIDRTFSGEDYASWPAAFGAPVDENRFPTLVSDMDSWAVFNDVDLENHQLQDTPIPGLGVEVQQMTYQFRTGVLDNVVFIRWKITNKTDQLMDSVFFGLWSDPDLGIALNDLFGTDTLRNMVYIYNFVNENTPTGKQYACGYKLMFASVGGQDIRLFASTYYIGSTDPRDPSSDAQRYNYLRGLTRTGEIRLAEHGFVETDGARFLFPGDPVTGQGLISASMLLDGSDIRLMTNIAPFDLGPGETVDIIFAIVAGEGYTRNGAILNLRARSDALDHTFPDYVLPRLNLDVDPPNIELSVLQNPESSLSDRVRLYVTGDEELSAGVGTATLKGEETDFFLEWIPGSDNLLTGEFELNEAGPLELNITARDLAGNPGTLTRNYDVFRLRKDRDNTVTSDDGQFSITAPGDAVQADGFGLIGSEPRNEEHSLGPAYFVSTAAVLSKPFWIQFKSDPKAGAAVICRKSGTEWVPLETVQEGGVARASVERTGTFALFKNGSNLPGPISLLGNYPNPFNPSTSIRFHLSEPVSVKLTVYNVLGQQVAVLANGPLVAGEHAVGWDGKNTAGLPVASGIYVYLLEAGKFVQSRKMMLLR